MPGVSSRHHPISTTRHLNNRYRLRKPAASYVECFQHTENRLRVGELLKTQLLKTPKVNFERLFQVVCGKAISFLVPVSVKQRLRERMTRTLILAEAAYLALCVDDIAEVLYKGDSRAAHARRRVSFSFLLQFSFLCLVRAFL